MIVAFALAAALVAPPNIVDLAARDERALSALRDMTDDEWNDPTFTASLNQFFRSPGVDDDARYDALAALAETHHLAPFHAAIVEWIDCESAKPDGGASRELAKVLALGYDDDDAVNPTPALLRLFRDSSGVIRREALIIIADHGRETLDRVQHDAIVAALIDAMEDGSASPVDRGDAIDAVAAFRTDDARLTAALLDLSRSERWFDGAPGNHGPQSSISGVIKALSGRQRDPAVAQRLVELQSEVHSRALDDYNAWLCDFQLKWAREHPPK